MKKSYHLCVCVSGLALTLALGAGAAGAQDATPAAEPAASDTVVVVTGLRKSMQSSAQIKKNTQEIVDSVNAEDIGKLPDPNVADSLARIPGVQLYRYAGEGSSPSGIGNGVSIRGLQGQTRSEYNGRSFYTAGQRDYSLDNALPELVSGLDVFKNPSAEHIEGAIGGLVNIRTAHPFDNKGRVIVASAKANYYDFDGTAKPTLFGEYSDRWQTSNGEIGFLVAAGYQESAFRNDAMNINTWTPRTTVTNGDGSTSLVGATPNPDGQNQALISTPNDFLLFHNEHGGRTRYGINTALQYRNEKLEAYIDADYTYYEYNQPYYFLFPTLPGNATVSNLVTRPVDMTYNPVYNYPNTGLVSGQEFVSGTYHGVMPTTTSGRSWTDYTTGEVAAGLKYHVSEKLLLSADAQYVQARRFYNENAVNAAPIAGLTWDETRDFSDLEHPVVTLAGPSLSDANNWQLTTATIARQETKDHGVAIRGDLKYNIDAGPLADIKAGLRYADQTSTFNGISNTYAIKDAAGNPILLSATPSVDQSDTNWMRGTYGFQGGVAMFDRDALENASRLAAVFPNATRNGAYNGAQPSLSDNYQFPLLNYFQSVEKTSAAYLVGDLDFSVASIPVKGNVGMRIVKTESTAAAYQLKSGYAALDAQADISCQNTSSTSTVVCAAGTTTTDLDLIKSKNEYTDTLPSLNLTAYLQPSLLLRFGYSKGISRVGLGSLNPKVTVNSYYLNQSPNTPILGEASAGNPDLQPQRGTNYDLSLEKYFGSTGYIYGTVFKKDVTGFVSTVAGLEAVAGYSRQLLVSRPVNGLSGEIDGYELGGQSFLTFLPGFWSNFGVQANFAHQNATNDVNLGSATVPRIVNVPLEFQSKNSYNLVGFYEDGTLTARVAYNYRSDYLRGINGGGGLPNYDLITPGYGTLDASLSIKLSKQLNLTFEGSNLTNSAPDRWAGNGVPRLLYQYDRRYAVSVRYRFGS